MSGCLSTFSCEYLQLSGFLMIAAFLSDLTTNNEVTERGEMDEVALFVHEVALIMIDYVKCQHISFRFNVIS